MDHQRRVRRPSSGASWPRAATWGPWCSRRRSLKIYLDATLEERARRRFEEERKKGSRRWTLEEVERSIAERDREDEERGVAPLVRAPDAVTVDTTGRTPAQVLDAGPGFGTLPDSSRRVPLGPPGGGPSTCRRTCPDGCTARARRRLTPPPVETSFPPHARTRQDPAEGDPRPRAPRSLTEVFGADGGVDTLQAAYDHTTAEFGPNKVVKGKIVDIRNDEVVVDVGYKSEGVIPLERVRRRDRVRRRRQRRGAPRERRRGGRRHRRSPSARPTASAAGSAIVETHKEGDAVRGRVLKKIKGGLLVDIGVPVFLPASQVDIRRPGDIGEFIGKDIEARIIKIDEERMNIVISRRKLIEEQRDEAEEARCSTRSRTARSARASSRTSPTSARSSTSAASTACCTSPTCRGAASTTRARCSRSTRRSRSRCCASTTSASASRSASSRRSPSPWEKVEHKYPVGSRVKGEVVNIMSYGAFVQARGRHRGPGPHLRDVVDASASTTRARWSRSATRSRSSCSTSTRRSRKSRSA